MMADGYLGKCKECTKADVRKRAAEKPEQLRAYDRLRQKDPKRRKLKLKYQQTARAKYPQKARAHGAVSYAVRAGWLKRLPCEVCGSEKSEAHHDDYSKPLEVRWLCLPHHREADRKRKG